MGLTFPKDIDTMCDANISFKNSAKAAVLVSFRRNLNYFNVYIIGNYNIR